MKQLVHFRMLLQATLLFYGVLLYGQTTDPIQYSPGGLLDNVYDNDGRKYNLSEIMFWNNTSTVERYVDPSCSSGIFVLHFDVNSGMENPTDLTHQKRREIVCQVFRDISDLLKTPLKNAGATQRVHIWVRDIHDLINNPETSITLAVASSFYNVPTSTNSSFAGGIVDNEIWKTIHLGIDSYTNSFSPLNLKGDNGMVGNLFHGHLAVNFSNPLHNWSTELHNPPTTLQSDMYSTILHEVIHALGFASLISENGTSKLNSSGNTNFNYYSRYDEVLTIPNSSTSYISRPTTSPRMYHFNFTTSATSLTGSPCTTIAHFGSSPVYTPSIYASGSSLSHFDDSCLLPSGNNLFYVMNFSRTLGTVVRQLKSDELDVLCQIGYSLNSGYGTSSNLNATSYSGNCTGAIRVAGVNDGIDSNGNYNFIATTSNTISLTNLLANDRNYDAAFVVNTPNNLTIEALTDMYDPAAQINGSTTPYTGNANSITYSSTVPGIHLLRYVPYNTTTEQRGNITYVYVFVTNSGCSSSPVCGNMVNNEGFENNSGCGLVSNSRISCWYNLSSHNSSLYVRGCTTPTGYNTGVNTTGVALSSTIDSHNGVPNNSFLELALGALNGIGEHYATSNQTLLNSVLQENQTYTISFWAINKFNHVLNGSISYNSTMPIPLSISSFSSIIPSATITGSFNTTFSVQNPNLLCSVQIPIDNTWHFYSQTITMPAGVNHTVIAPYIEIPTNDGIRYTKYILIDDISIKPITQTGSINLPDTLCINGTLTNLDGLLSMPPFLNGTFSWSLNGGAFTNIVGTTFTPTVAGTYTINYSYTNNVGCPVTISDTIEVTACATPVTPTFTQVAAICSGGSFTLSTTSIEGITGTWAPAIDNSATTQYTFTPTAGQNATTTTMTVTVNPRPTVTVNSPTVCDGQTATLTATPTPAGTYNYAWTVPATVPNPGNVASFTTIISGQYCVTITDTVTGCASDAACGTVTVNITTAPSATSPPPFCSNANPTVANLTATGTGINWYTTATGGTALATTTSLSTGTYYVSQTENSCESTRTPVSVTVNSNPTISTQPVSQTVCAGSSPNLSVTATGTGLTYQWYSNTTNSTTNGTPIAISGTSSTYSPPTTAIGTMYYYVVVSNSDGCSITSNVVYVTVNGAVINSTSAIEQGLCVSAAPSALTVSVTGSGTIAYQWYSATTLTIANNHTGTLITSATNVTYLPPTSSTAVTKYYYVKITVGSCTIYSDIFTITFYTKPTISSVTGTQTLCKGATPTNLQVTATGTITGYQWYSNTANNNTTGTPIAGATATTYTPPTNTAGTFYYYVGVSNNSCEVKSSTIVKVTVNEANINSTSAPVQGLCTGITPSAISVNVTGYGTITYQWYTTTSLTTATNHTSTTTAIGTGATTSSFTPPTSSTAVTIYYYVKITVGSCTIYSDVFTITFYTKPTISSIIGTQTLCKGAIPTNLQVTATGTITGYQWYSNTANNNIYGTPIAGATTTTYTPPTTTAGTFYYYVGVSNDNGCQATSNVVKVTVNGASIIPNSETPLTQKVCVGNSPQPLIIKTTFNSGQFLLITWYKNTTASTTGGTPVLTNGSGTVSGSVDTFSYPATFSLTPTTEYYYAVITDNYSCPVTSSLFTVSHYAAPTITSITPASQTVCTNGGNASLTTTPITVTTNAPSGSTLTYQWYSNTTNNTYTGTAIAGATGASYTPPNAVASSLYYYVVINSTGGCIIRSNAAYVNVIGPVITAATPLTQNVCPNTTIQPLQVTATGTNLTYQWYFCGNYPTIVGNAITGATGSSYTPTSMVSGAGNFYFYVTVTENGNCVLKSPMFVVKVPPAVSIAGNPTICLAGWNHTSLSLYNAAGVSGGWYSSNTAVATVDNNGYVTAYTTGTVTIGYATAAAPGYGCPSTASMEITVLDSGSLVAVNDNFTTPINTNTGGQTPSILANDTLNGNTISPGMVTTQIMGISSVPPQVLYPAFMLSGGTILVPQGTPVGTYTITYQINKCSPVTATAVFIVNQIAVPSPTIAVGVRANNIVMDVDTQSTGKIIISGYFDTYNYVPCKNIAQLNNDLTLDTNFNASGAYPPTASDFSAYDMKVIKNSGANFNKILLAGWFSGWSGGTNGIGIARLLENGNLDTGFNTQALADPSAIRGFSIKLADGSIQKGMAFEIFVFPDTAPAGYAGKILVGGRFNRYNGYVANCIVMLEPNGDYNTNPSSLAYQFNQNTSTAFGYDDETGAVGGFALQKTISGDYYILVGGSFSYLYSISTATNYKGLVRLNLNGTLDTTFGSLPGQGLVTTTLSSYTFPYSGIGVVKRSIVVQPDGKIIVGGYFTKYNTSPCNNLVRLMENGEYDPTFDTVIGFNNNVINPNTSEAGLVRDLYLDTAYPNNVNWKLYACGDFTSYNGTACDEVIRINCTTSVTGGPGTIDSAGFGMSGGGPNGANNGPVWCMKKQEGDPKIIIGGKFTYYTDTTHPTLNVTRIYPSVSSLESKNSSPQYESEPEIDIFTTTDVVLYPNPTDGLLYYRAENFGTAYTITVYDTMGRAIKETTVDEENKERVLDFSDMPSGTYLVRFNNATQHIAKTIIKR